MTKEYQYSSEDHNALLKGMIWLKWSILCSQALADRPTKGLEGPRVNTKSGIHNIDCVKGVWGHAPRFHML